MTISANGYIARENNSEDFLSHINWNVFVRIAEDIGCFVVGRKTYEIVKKFYTSGYNFDTVKAVRIVISNKPPYVPVKGYIFVKSPAAAIKKAKELGFKKLLLAGGGKTNSAFMKKELVDEVIFDVEPFVLGNGISVFAPQKFEYKLKLLKAKTLKEGILQIHYNVLR